METTIEHLKKLLTEKLPESQIKIDEPELAGGNYWVDVTVGKKQHTLEYRPGKGFGLYHEDTVYGEGPTEIYRTPDRVVQRLTQLMGTRNRKAHHLDLRDIRELYGHSQVSLAKKAGVKQPSISRFEKRGEVKLSTLAATIKALGGRLEVRAHFPDSNVPISLPTSKG